MFLHMVESEDGAEGYATACPECSKRIASHGGAVIEDGRVHPHPFADEEDELDECEFCPE